LPMSGFFLVAKEVMLMNMMANLFV
jgi:hypothetical protein